MNYADVFAKALRTEIAAYTRPVGVLSRFMATDLVPYESDPDVWAFAEYITDPAPNAPPLFGGTSFVEMLVARGVARLVHEVEGRPPGRCPTRIAFGWKADPHPDGVTLTLGLSLDPPARPATWTGRSLTVVPASAIHEARSRAPAILARRDG